MRGGRVVSVLVMPVGAGIIKRETEPVLFINTGLELPAFFKP